MSLNKQLKYSNIDELLINSMQLAGRRLMSDLNGAKIPIQVRYRSSYNHLIERAKLRGIPLENIPAAFNILTNESLCEFIYGATLLTPSARGHIYVYYKQVILVFSRVAQQEELTIYNLSTVLNRNYHNKYDDEFDANEYFNIFLRENK